LAGFYQETKLSEAKRVAFLEMDTSNRLSLPAIPESAVSFPPLPQALPSSAVTLSTLPTLPQAILPLPQASTLPSCIASSLALPPQAIDATPCIASLPSSPLDKKAMPSLRCPSNSEDIALQSMCLTFLSPHTIRAFSNAQRTNSDTLAPHTIRKALCSLGAAVKILGGGPRLSKLPSTIRTIARDSLDALHDAMNSFNRLANISINLVESKRLLAASRQNQDSTASILNKLFFLSSTEEFWLLTILTSTQSPSHSQCKLLSGCVFLRLLVCLPQARHGNFLAMNLKQLAKLNPTRNFEVTFEAHKNTTSGSLFLNIPVFATRVLFLYINRIRPFLVNFGEFSDATDKLFPPRILVFFGAFLKHLSPAVQFNPSYPRKVFCDYTAMLQHSQSKWSTFASDFVLTANHGTSNLVERHYAHSAKVDREKKLTQFIQEMFIEPSTETLLRITALDELPMYDFKRELESMPRQTDAPVRSRRLKRSALEAGFQDIKLCHNRKTKKKCLSMNFSPVFGSNAQVCCDECVAGYGGLGNLECVCGLQLCFHVCPRFVAWLRYSQLCLFPSFFRLTYFWSVRR
jgi:hypothetical protein